VAHSEDRRPGTWFGDTDADGRVLTQAETDTLIRAELVSMAQAAERDEVMRLIGEPRSLELVLEEIVEAPPRRLERYRTRKRRARATVQRGGIDSDPRARRCAHVRGTSRTAVRSKSLSKTAVLASRRYRGARQAARLDRVRYGNARFVQTVNASVVVSPIEVS
jgi:hypothetical protein